jgi:tmRNA-binding protein
VDQDYNINLLKRVLDDLSEASIDEFLVNSKFVHQPKLERQLLLKVKQLVENALMKDPMTL